MVSKTVLQSISANGPLRAAATVALLGGALGAAAASAEWAGNAELQTVIVTGTRIHDGPEKILGSTTVITASDIEASGNSNAIDLLRDTAGVHVVQPSGMGGVSRVFLRSGSQELAMVLLDGVRVNDPNDTRGATFDFSTLGMEDVERVEIVRGPQSAVYGSDALAGVVNFISREPPPQLGGTLHAEIGGDDFYRGAVAFGAPLGDSAGFSLQAATVDDGEPVEGTTFESNSVSGKLMMGRDDSWDLKLFGRYSDSEGTSFGEDSGGARLAVIRTTDARRAQDLSLGLQGGREVAGRWRLNMLTTWYKHDSTFSSPGIAPGVRGGVPGNGADASLERLNLSAHAMFVGSAAFSATFGADYYEEDGFSDGYLDLFPGFRLPNAYDFNRKVTGVFGEMQYRPGNILTLQASVRRDDPSGEAGETTGKLGALIELDELRTTVRANWGQGFKLPGFFSLSSPLVGNPGLRPEKSESADLSVTHWSQDRTLAGTVGVFHSKYSDLIDFDGTLFQMVNMQEVTVSGVEFNADYDLGRGLSLAAHATYSDIDVKGSAVPLRQMPDWRGGIVLRWAPATEWQLDASWLYVGDTFDSSVPTGDAMLDPYHRVDANVIWTPVASLSFVLAVDNLLDEQYEEAIGFPAVGRRARLGLRYRF